MATITLTVTVSNPGSGNRYYIDGALQATVSAIPGNTYKFDQADNSNSGHPLRLSITSNGTHAGGSAYTTGVTTSGTPGSSGAYTQIEVTALTVQTLYYYCTNHSGMGGSFNVGNSSTLGLNEMSGFPIQNLTTDSTSVGQMYYNSTSGQFKGILDGGPPIGTWASGGNFPGPFYLTGASGGNSTAGWTAAGQLNGSTYINESYEYNGSAWGSGVSMNRNTGGQAGGNGPQTAGIVVSGYQNAPSATQIANCETYNGSAWANIEDLPANRNENTVGGTSAAATTAGGSGPPGAASAEYYTYNGSSWTDAGDINTARKVVDAGNGSATSMLVISGNDPVTTNVESWNGSSWTEVSEVNAGRYRGQAAGADNTAAIYFGGTLNPGAAVASTESWNGTAWTEVGDLAQQRTWPGGNGTTSAAFAVGGDSGPGSNNLNSTEIWSAAEIQVKTLTTS